MKRAAVTGLLAIVVACSSGRTPTTPDVPLPVRVLMLTATAGFRHDSIGTARQVMTSLGTAAPDVRVTVTEDLSTIGAATLADHDVLFFALTSGELAFSAAQQAAILDFVSGGKGFIGVHSATDTLYAWTEYGRLVGAYFKEHPWTQQGTVLVADGTHQSTRGLGDRFSILEEFYTFRENPAPPVQILLRLDPASVGASGDFPLAWAQSFGNGRAYYNALGHFSSTWTDARFQQQLIGAIRWTAGR